MKNDLQNISFDKLYTIYSKYFSLHYLNSNMGDKLACIALTCYITNEIRKKGKKINCYDVLLKIACQNNPRDNVINGQFGDVEKNTFLKSLGVICEDFMYGCNEFLDFGIKPKDMPKTLQNLLNNYCPF